MIGTMRAPRPWSVAVNKRGGRYIVDVSVPETGKRRVYRQGFAKKDPAEAHANAIRGRLGAGLPPFATEQERRPAVTVLEVLEGYQPKTPRGEQHIEAFRDTAIASRSAEGFELADLEGFLVERRNLKTCSKDFSFLKRACAYAKAKGRISHHYFEKLAGDPVTRRRLMPAYRVAESIGREIPDQHLEAIFAHLAKDARRAVLFARTTGCRKGEVASLDWRKHWTAEGFRPLTQKGSSPRVVAYDAAILGPRRPGGLVFSELGGTVDEIYQRLTCAWRYAVKASKVPVHYRFHDIRHTFGTRLRSGGMTFSDIAAVMGITELMAHVYAHEDRKKIQIDAQKFAANATVSRLAELA